MYFPYLYYRWIQIYGTGFLLIIVLKEEHWAKPPFPILVILAGMVTEVALLRLKA
jgi:hypothetical protein